MGEATLQKAAGHPGKPEKRPAGHLAGPLRTAAPQPVKQQSHENDIFSNYFSEMTLSSTGGKAPSVKSPMGIVQVGGGCNVIVLQMVWGSYSVKIEL